MSDEEERSLSQQLSRVLVQQARLETKLDGSVKGLDGINTRLDQQDKQRDTDRNAFHLLRQEIAGVTATCKFHIDQTVVAVDAATRAAKDSAVAREKVEAIESSWHDLRRRPGSAEHAAVGMGLESRAKTKETAEMEQRVASSMKQILRARDEERARVLEERASAEKEDLERKEAAQEDLDRTSLRKYKTVQMYGRLVTGVITVLVGTGGIGLWWSARNNQQIAAENLVKTQEVLKSKMLPSPKIPIIIKPDSGVR